MTIYVFGNPLIKEDSIPIEFLPTLKKFFPEITFKVVDPNENFPSKGEKDLVILDTVLGIKKTTILNLDNLKKIKKTPISPHDYDLLMHLLLLKKLKKINSVKIIAIPFRTHKAKILQAVKNLMITMKNNTTVSITKGNEYQSTIKSLELIKDQIIGKINKIRPREIFLKPNWLVYRPDWLSITKLDTLRAIIDFFNQLGNFKFTVGDGVPMVWGWTSKEFLSKTNYFDLEKEYKNIKVIDLNDYSARKKMMANTVDGDKPIRYYKPVLDAEFLISVAKIKTHDTFANTLSLKNVIVGCAYWRDKIKFHAISKPFDPRENKPDKKSWYEKTLPLINFNFYKAAKAVYPDLAVIDGVSAMEGNGPADGIPVDLGITLASLDALSADIIATKVMGFKISEIPYLDLLNDEMSPDIEVIGEKINKFKYRFKTDNEYEKLRCGIKKKDVLKLIKHS